MTDGISDHKLVLIEVENDMITKAGQTSTARLVWQYKRADRVGLQQELWDNFEKWTLTHESVETRWIKMVAIKIDAKSKADALNKYHFMIFTAGEKYTEHIRRNMRGQAPMACRLEAVIKAIKSLKNGKSPGLDGLTSTFLKIAGLEVATYLDSLYKQIIREGVLPTDWKKAVVIPIHKREKREI